MKRERIGGTWLQLLGKVRAKWGNLTHEDGAQIAGRLKPLRGKLKELYGIDNEDVEPELAEMEMSNPQ